MKTLKVTIEVQVPEGQLLPTVGELLAHARQFAKKLGGKATEAEFRIVPKSKDTPC